MHLQWRIAAESGRASARTCMVEKFIKPPLSRNTRAAHARCAGVAALGAVFFAAASSAAPTAAEQPVAAPASAPTVAAGFSYVKTLRRIKEYSLHHQWLTVPLVPHPLAPGGT